MKLVTFSCTLSHVNLIIKPVWRKKGKFPLPHTIDNKDFCLLEPLEKGRQTVRKTGDLLYKWRYTSGVLKSTF